MTTKTCPRCAERVKAAARVCRYCGHEFGISLAKPADAEDVTAIHDAKRRRVMMYAAIAAAVLLVVVLVGYLMAPDITESAPEAIATKPVRRAEVPVESPRYPMLAVGEQLEWSAEKYPDEVVRQAGPLTIQIGRKVEDDLIAPVVTVTQGNASVTMTGEATSDSYTHRIGAFQNVPGGAPAVLFQSFSGGAHCCNHIQMAEAVGDTLRVVDLGEWDGDEIDLPKDVSGEGVADFVTIDQSFLYTFTAYAMSYAPPRILNVVGGKVVDVSTRPAFAKIFAAEVRHAGEACRTDKDGAVRNGACASYVAAAARIGRLLPAWNDMMASYDATQEWEYPTSCAVGTTPCPEDQTIRYKGYPEALLAFLKEGGYVPAGWLPTEPAAPESGDDEGF